MILYFADRQMNIIGQASTELPEGLTVEDDLKTVDVESGVAVFEFTIPFDKNTRSMVESCAEVGNYILRSHENENEFYTIIEAEIDTKNQEAYIYAEDAGLDLLNEVFGEFEADAAYTIDYYINKFAYDSGFEIGINEAEGLTRKLKWEGNATATERIASVATQFGGFEISYSYDIEGLEIVKKYINIHKERGQDNGVQLRLNKEIDSIVAKKTIRNLATALECKGGIPEDEELPITLDGYSYDDGDFYVEGTRLYSRQALERWSRYNWPKEPNQLADNNGHIVGQYSYETTSQQTLCAHAITELKKARQIEVNYEVDFTELPEGTKIGDWVNVIDDDGELYVSARILWLEVSVANKKKKVTLGEYLIKTSGISQKVAQLAAQFAENTQSTARALVIADNAVAIADEAQAQANSATTDAANAQSTADAAQAAAAKAAADAQSAADDADAKAAQAAADLATAQQNLANVTSRVDATEAEVEAAQAAVVTAQNAADKAQEEAEAAQATADTAKANAATAQTAADNAKTAADEAQQAAEDAQKAADDAQAAVDALAVRVTSAETKITQNSEQIALMAKKTEVTETLGGYYTKEETDAAITLESDSIKSTVSSTYATKQTVEAIKIGGRNLVPVSRINGVVDVATTEEFELRNVWASTFVSNSDLVEILEPATQYTVRYNLELIERTDVPTKFDMMVGFLIYSAACSTWISLATGMAEDAEIGTTKTVQITFTTPDAWNDESIICYSRRWTTDGASPVGFDAFKVTDFKIEKGNKATDWTPAPEDVDSDIEAAQETAEQASESATEANERITTAESLIQQLSNCIATLVTDGNGESLMTQTDDGWSFNMAQISDTLDSATADIDALTESLGGVDNTVNALKQALEDLGILSDYVIVTTYNEQPCIELGESENNFKLRITNTEIQFVDGTAIPAYVSNKKLMIEQAEVKDELQFGGFVWKARSNGNMGLSWKGVSN